MNYTEVISTIKNASLFDLYRLNVAIRNEMENPDRIAELRKSFKEGDVISYFNSRNNNLEQAKVIQKNKKCVVVENISDSKHWKVLYHSLNLNQVDTDIHNHDAKLSKNTLKVGSFVGFNNDGKTIVGVIIRLNHKTVSLVTPNNHRWRASYACLFRIIDADIINQFDPKQIALWIQEEKISSLELEVDKDL